MAENDTAEGLTRRRGGEKEAGDTAPSKRPSVVHEQSAPGSGSILVSICRGLSRLVVGLFMLTGVLLMVLLALPADTETMDGGAGQDEPPDAIMGNWEAAFFCDDELHRAGRIMKASNYVARIARQQGAGLGQEYAACRVVQQAIRLTKQLHACVVDLWFRRGMTAAVDPAVLRQQVSSKAAWWNAILRSALTGASLDVLERAHALHLVLSLQLPPWAVDALLERNVSTNSAAGPCGLTPLMLSARMGDTETVLALYRAGANVSATDCNGCRAHDFAAGDLAFQLRTWHSCGPSASSQQCLNAHRRPDSVSVQLSVSAGAGGDDAERRSSQGLGAQRCAGAGAEADFTLDACLSAVSVAGPVGQKDIHQEL